MIRTAQPLGNLLIYLVEPESDDGLVTWNFFDDQFQRGELYPIMRLPNATDLETEPANLAARRLRDYGQSAIIGESRAVDSVFGCIVR